MIRPRIGIIGGTGIDEIEGLAAREEMNINTPFGSPSSDVILGEIYGLKVAFLPRHGIGHVLLPSEINYRANIMALKMLGVEFLLSLSAVGSLKEDIKPLNIVLPDQFFDRTKSRKSTFFGDGIVSHVNFSEPTCPLLRNTVFTVTRELGLDARNGGTYICIEGPQFSTKAESNIYRSWGLDVIGMTNIPEAKLAREAEICYCTIALVTDYDCWHESYGEVDTKMVLENLKNNSLNAKNLIRETIRRIPKGRNCKCCNALENAIITKKDFITERTRKTLGPILEKYVK